MVETLFHRKINVCEFIATLKMILKKEPINQFYEKDNNFIKRILTEILLYIYDFLLTFSLTIKKLFTIDNI